jgi:HAMP domain-containing protein
MSLRARTILLVTLMLAGAVLAIASLLTWRARQAVLDQQASDGVLLAHLLARTTGIVNQFPKEMEDAIAEQMVVEATITAHIVAIAEQGGMTSDEINAHLKEITAKTALQEFWITDSRGCAYLHNIELASGIFCFTPTQRQASAFYPLLTGEKSVVIQDAQVREVDNQSFKYVGVAGIDKPRIVQVGYNATKIDELRQSVGVDRLVEQLVNSGAISAVRVVYQGQEQQVLRAGEGVNADLTQNDMSALQQAIQGDQDVQPYTENHLLKIVVPIHESVPGNPNQGAIIVYLPTDRLDALVRTQAVNAAILAGIILLIGAGMATLMATVVTRPVQQLMDAASAVERGEYQRGRLKAIVARYDEIGKLGHVFDAMALQVMARNERLNLLKQIIPAGVAMSAEKDFNRLMETIVVHAQQATNADAGTLYLLTEDNKLQFVIVRNTSLNMNLGGTTGNAIKFVPLSLYDEKGEPNYHHIATFAALKNQRINIADAYEARDFDFSGTKAFDAQTGYRSKSFMTIPLRGDNDGVIGVLQLINARDRDTGEIIPFSNDEVVDALSLLASAALAGYIREEKLRQELNKLRIEVDVSKQAKQVAEITETNYFQELATRARQMRASRKQDKGE